jgi:hypothetical protein
MRASLPHTLRERRRTRAEHPRRTPPAPMAVAPVDLRGGDPAVERVRSSGGPLDEAAYVCACGFSFRAPVSTTVACPHCRTQQAW